MTKREVLAWLATALVAAGFVGSLLLNRAASSDLRASNVRLRQLDPLSLESCAFDLPRARRYLDRPSSEQRRANMLVAAYGAVGCLDDEAASVIRQKIIAVETSGAGADRDLVGDLGREVVRLVGEHIERRRQRLREAFDED